MGSKSRKHPLGAEHERHASAVDHDLILGLLLDSIKELPEANVGADSEVTLAESHEVGEKKEGIGAYVVRLEAIRAKH